ncbi:MAG: malonyl-CoA decarboxylase [Pseudomonadota bacterium]
MQRNRFLGDILSTLFDRRSTALPSDDTRDIFALCNALLSQEGDVSGQKLVAGILAQYRGLSDAEKVGFFSMLNDTLDIDARALANLAQKYAENPDPDLFEQVSRAAEPPRQELLRRLNQSPGATADLVSMRTDLLRMMKDHPDLERTNQDFVHLLRSWFNRGFLVLKQINWDTPARVLDKIVAYEAVHQIDDWDDLRRRLYPPDRRCFAFFHPAMPDEPLIFVEVALTQEIPGSIGMVLSEHRDPLPAEDARVAVFYSISNCQKGLAGISFGNLLIKQVVAELTIEFPQLTDFVTLSPMPGFLKWLDTQTEDPSAGPAATDILNGTAKGDDVRAMAARYLVLAKRDDERPVDPVARFHLGNGAEIHDIHADADSSPHGLAQSAGAMVNYLYDLAHTERNHEDFALRAVVVSSRTVTALADGPLTSKPKELST